MTLPAKTWVWLVLLAIYLPKHSSCGQQARVVPPRDLLPVEATTCIFADREARFSYVGATGVVAWTLSAANRTLSQGEMGPITDLADLAKLTISLIAPPLKPGVVLSAELRLTWNSEGQQWHHVQPVTIYSADPFSIRRTALEAAQITLFDPVGDTADVLDAHDIPHASARSLSVIDKIDAGVVIVGEGASLRQQPSLLPALARAAERGVSVICLAPADGEFDFPTIDAGSGPLQIAFEQRNVVRRYDKRFDLLPALSHLAVESRRGNVFIEASANGPGWSWFNANYAASAQGLEARPTQLIVCGLSIIRDWEATPVPRYMLVHLLEERAANATAEELKNADFTQR